MGMYECSNEFMIRMACLPKNDYLRILECKTDLSSYIKENTELHKYMEKSLLIGSASLYKSYRKDNLKKKELRDLNCALGKYLIRATTRPTPYGIFASVALGQFGDENSIKKKTDQVHITMDRGWLNKVLSNLLESKKIKNTLVLYFNENCCQQGNRLYNPYCSNALTSDDKHTREFIDIELTEAGKFVFEKCNGNITYEKLIEELKAYYSDIEYKVIENFVDTLIEKEFLYTDFRIPAYCEDPLDYIINLLHMKKLEEVNLLTKKLVELHQLLKKCNKLDLNREFDSIIRIITESSKIQQHKEYLRANTEADLSSNTLSSEIKRQLDTFVETIAMVSTIFATDKSGTRFFEAFQETYGLNVIVPIETILNPNGFNGLRYLNDLQLIGSKENRGQKIYEKLIKEKYCEAMMSNEKIIHLDRKDFNSLKMFVDVDKQINSFDLNFFVTADDNHITLGPNIGSKNAGAMFQRFGECFENELWNRYQTFSYKNNMQYSEIDLYETHNQGRIMNIINDNTGYRQSLILGTFSEKHTGKIKLKDLGIYITSQGRICLYNLSLKKDVKLLSDNMINERIQSSMTQFLKAITNDDEGSVLKFLNALKSLEYPYVPEIQIEGITVTTEKWIFDKLYKDKDTFFEELNQFRHKYKMPDRVYLCFMDNRLIVDFNSDICKEIIYKEYNKKYSVEFTALEKDLFRKSFVRGMNDDEYIAEYVISFRKMKRQGTPVAPSPKKIISKNRIIYNTDNGWIYIKVYGIDNRIDKFLVEDLQQLKNSLKADLFFFVRYGDYYGQHIRIRFKFINEETAYKKIEDINKWSKNLISNNKISDVTFGTYEREINRYGGYDALKLSEKFFYYDSLWVLDELCILNNSNEEEIYLRDIIYILHFFFKDIRELFAEYYEYNNSHKSEYYKYYREKYQKYDMLCYSIWKKYEAEYDNWQIMSNLAKDIICSIDYEVNSLKNIVRTLIHMHCNRLKGDRELEQRCYDIVLHALHKQYSKQIYTKNNL